MILFGDGFFLQNAQYGYTQIQRVIEAANKFQKVNLNFVMSTPTKYVEALEKENAKSSFPSKYGDFLNEDRSEGVNQGLYSFRPSFKKHIKDASYQYYSLAYQFAHKVIDLNVTQEQADKFVKSSEQLLDQISIMQGSEILVGP